MPLYLSVVVNEEALRSNEDTDEFLDTVSRLDVGGFYLIVRRTQVAYRASFEPQSLQGLLRFCYSLAELNDFEVIVGYADLIGMMLHAVGVTATGSGWFNSLRQFTFRRFEPSTGGRQPRPRYTSGLLQNSILVSELDDLFALGQLPQVVSNTSYDAVFSGNVNPLNVPWSRDDSVLHHWNVLNEVVTNVGSGRMQLRLDSAVQLISNAAGLYSNLLMQGAQFETESGPGHLDQWRVALEGFRNSFGI